MDQWAGRVAVVTGASSGIGAAIAKMLVKEGLVVCGFARRIEKMEELATQLACEKGILFSLRIDITKEDQVIAGFKWIRANLGPVHILINNAGIVKDDSLFDGDSCLWRQILDTNILAVCIVTKEALKHMTESNINGHVIHINSIAGHYIPYLPFAKLNLYPASKFAITALTETLRQEINQKHLKIKVTSISPGLVDTRVHKRPHFTKEYEDAMKDFPKLKPEDIAEAVKFALGRPPHVQIHELTLKPVGEVM